MASVRSDAVVFFGATGDLAYRQIFPALQALVRNEGLNLPIIGVAKAGWTLDRLKARAMDSLEKHGGRDPEPVLGNVTPLYTYPAGTWGPEEAGQLIAKDGIWENPVLTNSSNGYTGNPASSNGFKVSAMFAAIAFLGVVVEGHAPEERSATSATARRGWLVPYAALSE